ncbi:MAG: phosphoglycerate kinase [Planctomycetes bacterium]|nr:phosphoglycerate kinase [Planctomycetota bacterium]MCB9918059.1 phosphoglycerate kinase [Planctomycetota bacterium]
MAMKRLEDLDVAGKRVLVRVDFNVPLDEHQNVTSDARIVAAIPTLTALRDRGARLILMSHLGRPKGAVNDKLRMLPVAERLHELTGWPVRSAPEIIGPLVKDLALSLEDGEVLMLENLRFDPREEAGDAEFGAELAALGEVFVQDAFGTCHRAHASVARIPEHLPSAPGLLLAKEIDAFAKVLDHPERPFVAILGGAKVSDKLPVLENLLPRVDRLIIGGAMAYTFLKAQGKPTGKSLVEDDLIDEARRVMRDAEAAGKVLALPVDHVVTAEFRADSPHEVVTAIPDGMLALDIGPRTSELYTEHLKDAKTVLWNGPMGVFEMEAFRKGTEAVARAVANCKGFRCVGGGDSVAALELLGLDDAVDHVSTGGGASLELLEGKVLPGVAALQNAST